MTRRSSVERLVLGAAAGFVGTLALQLLRTGSRQAFPATMPPIRREPGDYMVDRAESVLPDPVRERIPQFAETAAAKSLAAGYGVTAGVAYAALRPRGGDPVPDGVLLGLGTWAAGYLGWLPALGLMPPVPEQSRPEALGPILRHALFGVVAVAAFNRLAR